MKIILSSRRALLAAVVSVGTVLVAAHSYAGAVKYKIGDKIENFSYKDDAGKSFSLAKYKGKTLLIIFYASWCPPCNEEAPHVEKEIWEKYKNKNVQVLGIAIQEGAGPAAKIQKFRKAHGITYPLILDEQANLIQRFGFSGIPQGIVIDSTGKYTAAPETVAEMASAIKKVLK